MNPVVASAFMAMSTAQTLDDAEEWGCLAAARGATDAEVAHFLDAWAASRAAEPRTVESQPTPAPRCLCSHRRHSGQCYSPVCGCRTYREKASA